jgi:membrane protein implicated in regulation of membrane protease activity
MAMDAVRAPPGPAAHAYRLGLIAASLVGFLGVGLLYWFGLVTALFAGYTLLFLFPVYLVFVAVLLGRWLRYDRDGTALRPIVRDEGSE